MRVVPLANVVALVILAEEGQVRQVLVPEQQDMLARAASHAVRLVVRMLLKKTALPLLL